MNELEIVNFLKEHFPKSRYLKKGIGDDCAVLDFGGRYYVLVTTDMLIEGVHFRKGTPLEEVWRKAVAVSLSDMSSCGGTGLFLFLSAGLPKKNSREMKKSLLFLKSFLKKYKITLAGGDTNYSPQTCIDSILVGRVEKNRLVLRKGARVGDYLFVTGKLGKARYGKNHIFFTPRVKESRLLVENFCPSSMIDISDGLSLDLYRVLDENKKGAVLFEERLPLYRKGAVKEALFWGEDYELLFTLSPLEAKKFISSPLYGKFAFSHIGTITRDKGLYMRTRGNKIKLVPKKGYVHL